MKLLKGHHGVMSLPHEGGAPNHLARHMSMVTSRMIRLLCAIQTISSAFVLHWSYIKAEAPSSCPGPANLEQQGSAAGHPRWS
jgi:hypothetical protein